MALKFGGLKGEDIGVLAGGLVGMLGGPIGLAAAPLLYSALRSGARDEEEAERARFNQNALLSGVMPAGEDPNNGIAWNQARPVDESELTGLAARAVPGVAMEERLKQIFPEAETFGDPVSGVDEQGNPVFVRPGSRGGYMTMSGIRPQKESKGPGPRGWFREKKTGKLFQGYESAPGIRQGLELGEIELAADPTANASRPRYRAATPAEIASAGLDPTGSYQVDETSGKIDVITQPKQSNPTEGQQKAAQLAGRVADALGTVGKILETDPDAQTNWLLDATSEGLLSHVPGVAAAGRKFSNPNAQIVRNNLVDAIDATITMGTGAAYNQEQLIAKRNALLPQVGEDASVKADKFRKLMVEYDLARQSARAAGKDLPEPSTFAKFYGLQAAQPDTSQLPPGATSVGNGRYKLPDGRIVKWVDDAVGR